MEPKKQKKINMFKNENERLSFLKGLKNLENEVELFGNERITKRASEILVLSIDMKDRINGLMEKNQKEKGIETNELSDFLKYNYKELQTLEILLHDMYREIMIFNNLAKENQSGKEKQWIYF